MKQVLQNLRNGETLVVDVPIPSPQPGEVLVRTAASLVSAGTERMVVSFAEKSLLGKARARPDLVRQVLEKGQREGWLTTLEAVFGRLDQPLALGYSSAGVVVGLGEGVQKVRLGQRVACAGGGYAVHAEYACVPVNLIAPLPPAVDFEAAAFTTLGAIALHGFRLCEVQIGERVAVIGLGLLGLLAAQIGRAAGCAVLGVDLRSDRLALAHRLGFQAVRPEAAEEATLALSQGRGCDAVLICADTPSNQPIELAATLARDRARVVVVGAVGLNLPRKSYYEKELTVINARSYGPGRYDPAYEEGGQDYPIGYVRWTEGRNLEAVIELLAEGKLQVQPLITHRFPIEQAPQAYHLIGGKSSEPFLGVLLTYGREVGISDQTSLGEATVTEAKIPAAPLPRAEVKKPRQGTITIGVLGAGNFAGAVMLPALRAAPQIRVKTIVSASGMSAQHLAKRFAIPQSSSEERQLLEDEEIEAVFILTRHHLHARQVAAALQAGKHVFCEKPLALNTAEMEHIAALLPEKHAGILMVGFNRRFAPLAVRLKTFLENRKEPLYAHYRVNAGYLPPTHWTQDPLQGGGRIIGEACHFVDFLIFLVGDTPQQVTAQGLPDGGRYREDNVLITLTFPDGSLGSIAYLANGDKRLPKERLEVFCGGRAAVLDDFRSLELLGGGKREKIVSRLRQDKGHRAEVQAFAQAILNGEPPPIPYDHLFGGMQATFAAVQSLRTERSVRLIKGSEP